MEPSTTIGERLREIRVNANLSLDETAKLTGVSKPMLGQIERGQSVPTITTLWKIATGLKKPLSSFLDNRQTEYDMVSVFDTTPITEDNGKMRAYPIFAFDPIRSTEMFRIDFDAGCRHSSDKHSDGVEEYVLVIMGKLQLVLNGEEIVIEKEQAIRFRADVPHEYNNPFDDKCEVYNIIYYPE